MRFKRFTGWLLLLPLLLAQAGCGWANVAGSGAREHFRPGFNLFSPEQDVELGNASAEEMARQVRLVGDERVVAYVRRTGERLAAETTGHAFPYKFYVVDAGEVNAFALPGGHVYVNAGAIAAARNEGELAGVLAHEIAHVALRHGTNQASKAYVAKAGLGLLGALAGGGGGDVGSALAAAGGAYANAMFLKFNREAETQADLEGARLMAAAGYDPRDMARFFEKLGGGPEEGASETSSDHPEPRSRVAAINGLAPSLRIERPAARDAGEFRRVKSRLSALR